MPLIHMVIADRDVEYVQRLTQWFRENKSQQFQISAFTEEESFNRYLLTCDSDVDVFLIEEKFVNAELTQKGNFIILGKPIPNLPSVHKYQAASSMCPAILSLMSQWNHQPEWESTCKSNIVVCFSPETQLKSSMALCLAGISQDHLYISMEAFPFYSLQNESSNRRSLSDILYHIKASKGNIAFAMESSVCCSDTGINFIPPMDNPKDLWELTSKENGTLMESLVSWGHFTNIILDIECNTSPMVLQWLELASCVVIPFTNRHPIPILKLKNMLSGLSNSTPDKLRWVLAGENGDDMFLQHFDDLHFLQWLNSYSAGNFDRLPEPAVEQLKALLP
jgi:hypothetical protein